MRRLILSSILALAALSAVPGDASAARYKVGVADNSPAIFANPLFTALKPKITRKIVPIDTIDKGGADLADLDAFMAAASLRRIEVLVTFNPTRSHFTPGRSKRADLPSKSAFTKAFKKFRARYPKQKVFSPWNEINSPSQPTFFNPRRAADFSNVVYKNCKKCTIVAGDFLDSSNMRSYYKKFRRALKFTPKYWGLHNYGDTNRFRTKFTKDFLKIIGKRPELWLTETGGFYKFCREGQTGSDCAFPVDENRQVKAMKQMFKLAKSNRQIKRLYIYHFFGESEQDRFDSGIVDSTGTVPRKAYGTVAAGMR